MEAQRRTQGAPETGTHRALTAGCGVQETPSWGARRADPAALTPRSAWDVCGCHDGAALENDPAPTPTVPRGETWF